jgi:surface polysaccharide O-acyltransferase-like enzyme
MNASFQTGRPAYLPYASAMRFIAVLAVVILHSSAYATVRCGELPMAGWRIAAGINSVTRWCVPVFIMLSGALLLDPARREPFPRFLQKRFTRILIPLTFWAAFYFAWFHFFRGDPFSWTYIRDQLLIGMTDSHLYFLFILLGLYLVTPVLRAYVAESPRRDIWILTAVLFVLNSASLVDYNASFNAFTRFYPYISYFLAGSLLRVYKPDKKAYVLAGGVFLLITAAIVLEANHLCLSGQKDKIEHYFEHFFPTVILQSLSAFLLLRLLAPRDAKPPAWVQELGESSFGIYLVHIAVLDWLRQYSLNFYFAHVFRTILAEVFIVAVISTALVIGLRRVPGVRRVLG